MYNASFAQESLFLFENKQKKILALTWQMSAILVALIFF